MTVVKVVFGLGNPGTKYDGTRHNAGFEVLNTLVESSKKALWPTFEVKRLKVGGQVVKVMATHLNTEGAQRILVKPLTYMNMSGLAFRAVVEQCELLYENCLVVYDDANLELGRIRARSSGSDGGQNGLKSILEEVGNESIPRLRIGVGAKPSTKELADHVLSRWSKEELPTVKQVMARAVEAINVWFEKDIETVMNQFNAPIKNEESE